MNRQIGECYKIKKTRGAAMKKMHIYKSRKKNEDFKTNGISEGGTAQNKHIHKGRMQGSH